MAIAVARAIRNDKGWVLTVHLSPWSGAPSGIAGGNSMVQQAAILHVLNQLLGADNGTNHWEGSMLLRLHVILQLYDCLDQKECQEPICKAMFHCYPLVVTSQPGLEDKPLYQDFIDLSKEYFNKLFEESPSTFKSFCSSFTAKGLSSLPDAVFDCISGYMDGRTQEDPELTKNAAAGLGHLFQHFLACNEDQDSGFYHWQVEEEQYDTLSDLIGLIIDCLAGQSSDPCWWKLSYSWLSLLEQQLAMFSATKCDPVLTGYDDNHYYMTDEIGNHSDHTADNPSTHADLLHQLIIEMEEALERYPLPLLPSRISIAE
jgi:hypothetical protein